MFFNSVLFSDWHKDFVTGLKRFFSPAPSLRRGHVVVMTREQLKRAHITSKSLRLDATYTAASAVSL